MNVILRRGVKHIKCKITFKKHDILRNYMRVDVFAQDRRICLNYKYLLGENKGSQV